jgi:uncharacterized membrane protein YbhN (UPF0104 family)
MITGRLPARIVSAGWGRRLAVLGLVAVVGLLAAWTGVQTLDVTAIGIAFHEASWSWVLVSAALYGASQFMAALVWREGLRAGGLGGISTRCVFAAHWISRGASEFLPAQLGEAARIAALRDHPALGPSGAWRVGGSIAAFKLVDGFVTLSVSVLLVVLLAGPGSSTGLGIAGAAGLVVCIGLIAATRTAGPRALLRIAPKRMQRPLRGFAAGARLFREWRRMCGAVGLQLVATVGRVLSLAALLVAFDLPVAATPLLFALLMLSGLIPLAPGGAGVREVAILPVLVTAFGAQLEVAIALSLGIQAVGLAVSVTGALVALAFRRGLPSFAPAVAAAPARSA